MNVVLRKEHGHVDRSYKIKNEILDRLQKGEKGSALAKEYKIPANTISTWKKNKDAIKSKIDSGIKLDNKRSRNMKMKLVEEALILWFQDVRSRSRPVPVSTLGLCQQAET